MAGFKYFVVNLLCKVYLGIHFGIFSRQFLFSSADNINLLSSVNCINLPSLVHDKTILFSEYMILLSSVVGIKCAIFMQLKKMLSSGQ